jgi:lysophospholipase L1-like esterase
LTQSEGSLTEMKTLKLIRQVGNRLSLALAMVGATLAVSPAAAQVSPGSKYVSLGSSYAAGPGVGTRDDAGKGCDRSLSNYAQIVARRFNLQLVDASCSGATTQNILSASQNGFPPQADAVDADTRLVTILIGGNDVNYIGNLNGYSCRDTGGTNCSTVSDAEVDRRFQALPAALDNVIARVRQRAPNAMIVLVGYLPAVPASGTGSCSAVPLSAEDVTRMRALYTRLAQAIGHASDRNKVPVVRSSQIGIGHEACADQPYVAGFHPAKTPGWSNPVPYHPVQAGMDRVAAALGDILAAATPSGD